MKKIQQHYYTNSQRGLYNKARGYDTIAKSKGLDESFIKNVLHRICIYKPPTGLQDDYSDDLSKYPEALTCIQPEEDILVIGKAVYKPFNFSNDRNTYFVHNLIIEDGYKDELIEKIYKLLHINSFSNESDGNTELPELELTDLQFDSELEHRLTRDELFKEFEINDDIFKTLVYCSIMSISDNKVLYIEPDAEISKLNSYSKLLLQYLLMCLPFEIRRKIGFTTYASEVGMKYVNIMFIDKFNKTIDKSELKYGYLFDLYNKSIPKLDNNLKNQSYLNFVVNNLEDIKKIQDFNSFADEVLKNTEDSIKVSVEIYNKICELYMIVNENMESYLESEDKILKLIGDLVSIKGIDKKAINPSYDELLKVKGESFDYENDTEAIVSFVRKLKTYYEIGDKFAQKTIDFILEVIKKSMNNVRNRIFDVIEDNSKMITALFNRLYENEEYGRAILFNRLEEELSKINDISGIAKFTDAKSEINSKLLEDYEIITKIKDRVEKIINRSDSSEIVNWFSLFTSSIEKKSEKIKEVFRTYNKELLDTLLKDYTIESISINEIDKLERIDLSIYKNTDSEEIIKKFKCLRDVLKVMQPVDRKIIEELSSLDASCREQVNERIKTEFKSSAKEENYSRLMLAFKKFTGAEENNEYNDFDFKELLKFIFQEKGEEEVVKFLCWTAKEESLFDRVVEEADCYFNGEEASLFENKQYREKLLNKKNSFMRGKLYPIYVSYKKKDDAYIDQERKHNKKKMLFILVPIGIMIIVAIPITVKHFWPKSSGKVITQTNTPQIETTPKSTSSPSVQNNANNTEVPKVDTDSIKQEETKRVREVLSSKQEEIKGKIDNMVEKKLKEFDTKTEKYGYICNVTYCDDINNDKNVMLASIEQEWKDDYFGIPEKNIEPIYSSKSSIKYTITFNSWINDNSDTHLSEKINAINSAVIEVVTKYMNNAFN